MSGAESTRVLVFARAPVAGAVKTRLIPRLGAEGAAELHRLLVQRALATARDANFGRTVLCCAPDVSHPFFQRCAGDYGAELRVQTGDGLGERMYRALSEGLDAASCVLLIGSDCPALSVAILHAAADALAGGSDLVLVPAADGGYVLIGARKIDRAVFEDVNWGTASVMQQTRARIRDLGWAWRELPVLWDVDRPEDLDRLIELGMPLPQAAGMA
jgi:rSAM/selenodomain-associated transferase 1